LVMLWEGRSAIDGVHCATRRNPALELAASHSAASRGRKMADSHPSHGRPVRSSSPRISRVGVVGVPVTDQDRALAFYVDGLGLEKRVDVARGDGTRWIEVAPAGEGTTIALVPARAGATARIETGVHLVVDTLHDEAASDVRTIHAELRSRGVDTDPEVVHVPGVPPMFSIRDPDGNVLRVVARHRPA
jgi:catechol 2,3-dioxygenase-like lactoylglutathione lyase family enzyme